MWREREREGGEREGGEREGGRERERERERERSLSKRSIYECAKELS